tara:strand:- start:2896 stop:3561 length:666 start_codon:yes stop_codon:yes gene_type:complete
MTNKTLEEMYMGPPKFDLIGPTVDDDVRRIIGRYGAEAVKEAVKIQTKPKRGRKPEKDWPELKGVIESDAQDWLNGGDPFSSRSNYSIAKDFADRNPGFSHPATMKRIERKLAQKRVWMTLVAAELSSYENYPYGVHIRTLEALSNADAHPVWERIRDRAKSNVADYEAKKGELPPDHMSMKEVEETARSAVLTLNALAAPKQSKGLVGLFSNYPPKKSAF